MKTLTEALVEADCAPIAARLGTRLYEVAPRNANHQGVIVSLVEWAETRGKEAELVRAAMDQNRENVNLKAFARVVLEHLHTSVPWYQSPDPLQTCIVGRDQVFVDRFDLRRGLQQLIVDSGWTALIVKPSEGSVQRNAKTGCSFTLDLINFVLGYAGDAWIVFIALNDTPANLGPGDLARRIALQMRLDLDAMPEPRKEAADWNVYLTDWVTSPMQNSGRTCWLIIDDIDKVRPTSETMDLIWKLALAAQTRPLLRLRVVLLGCSELEPSHVAAITEEIPDIDRGGVEAFFSRFYRHQGVDASDARVRQATDEALRGVPDEKSDRLAILQREVTEVARRIAAELRVGAAADLGTDDEASQPLG